MQEYKNISPDIEYDVVILGAGISGLSLAYYLKKLGIRALILESSDRTGGVIESSLKEGFLLEYGPQTCLLEPEILLLIKELGLQDDLLCPDKDSVKRFLGDVVSGDLKSFPHGLIDFIKTDLLSFCDKARLFKELFSSHNKGKEPDIDLGSIFSERFGDTIRRDIISALYLGVWGTTLDRLEAKSASPLVYGAYEDGASILKTLFRHLKNKKNQSKIADQSGKSIPQMGIATFKGGLQRLTDALHNNLEKNAVITSVRNLSFSLEKDQKETVSPHYEVSFKVQSETQDSIDTTFLISTKRIVFATPAKEASQMFLPALANSKNILSEISYAPMGILHAVIDTSQIRADISKDIRSGFGCLIPPGKASALLGVIFSGTLFPEHGLNSNRCLLTCFVGGDVYKDFSNVTKAEVREKALSELKNLFSFTTDATCLDFRYWERAIPLYEKGHAERTHLIQQFQKENKGIHFCSNILEGVSIPSRIRASMKLASELAFKSL